jgi:hypothetical protein
MPLSLRRSVVLLACAAALAAPGAGAGPAVKFLSAGRAYQGKPYSVTVAARTGKSCVLSVRYADGASQGGLLTARAVGGKASWKWNVPEVAAPGQARLTAKCGPASASRRITVVGTLVPPKIVVVKSGWSVRDRGFGATASYGLELRNTSPNVDANTVSVQVNFVLADNRLIGTATQIVPRIPAGSTYNHAGTLSFPGAAPIARLEFVIIVGAREKTLAKARPPALDNVTAIPQTGDPTWTGWVQGEVINDHPTMMLKNVQLSALLFDASGNVLGGVSGSAFNRLPPGTRQVFKLTMGADAVPYAKIASISVTALPTYETIP